MEDARQAEAEDGGPDDQDEPREPADLGRLSGEIRAGEREVEEHAAEAEEGEHEARVRADLPPATHLLRGEG